MILLNLIPEKEKKELWLLDTYIGVKNFLLLLLVGIIISSTMLLAGKIILLKQYVQTIEGNVISSIPMKISNLDIKNLKSEVAFIGDMQKNHVLWINFLKNFSAQVNPGITIASITMRDDGTASVSGSAKIRQNLIDFEKNINTSGNFKEFKFPYDILFKKDNILFSINLEFDARKAAKELL